MGLYQPQEGKILINQKYKVSEINLNQWRKKIAYAEHNNLVENGLSTGQKQWADLDKLFENSEKKEVFIFDEADNALDENKKKEFLQKIEKISKNKLKTVKPEKILEEIEKHLKNITERKKEIEKNFTNFWKREVKISSLREKTEIGTLPSEREAIMEEIQNLNTYNKTIEKGFKEGKIDVEIMIELRKELEK
ncbi:9944_t:CDS:2 [Paraglomus brasilianum]|uniref:9944_t:CDS:1 n=1 Tax=Paraglomus brasilianum TaxID=144538 RepID=A0A9N9FY60_9GLOM|nr:9944_t:CDS:2 [Paraglomus brasilianum]